MKYSDVWSEQEDKVYFPPIFEPRLSARIIVSTLKLFSDEFLPGNLMRLNILEIKGSSRDYRTFSSTTRCLSTNCFSEASTRKVLLPSTVWNHIFLSLGCWEGVKTSNVLQPRRLSLVYMYTYNVHSFFMSAMFSNNYFHIVLFSVITSTHTLNTHISHICTFVIALVYRWKKSFRKEVSGFCTSSSFSSSHHWSFLSPNHYLYLIVILHL